jgi:hypothetical protein
MKKTGIIITLLTALMFFSCGQAPYHKGKQYDCSFELDPKNNKDTINLVMDGKKQGKWIKTVNGKREITYYRNDTLISK